MPHGDRHVVGIGRSSRLLLLLGGVVLVPTLVTFVFNSWEAPGADAYVDGIRLGRGIDERHRHSIRRAHQSTSRAILDGRDLRRDRGRSDLLLVQRDLAHFVGMKEVLTLLYSSIRKHVLVCISAEDTIQE